MKLDIYEFSKNFIKSYLRNSDISLNISNNYATTIRSHSKYSTNFYIKDSITIRNTYIFEELSIKGN